MPNTQKGLIGEKLGMTQLFADNGDVLPVTAIQTGPCTVLQIKTSDGPDGYDAIQLGFGKTKTKHISKALQGHYAKANGEHNTHRVVQEIRSDRKGLEGIEVGQVLNASDVFSEGDIVDVVGQSKGKGFAGVMKRYNFQGFIRTHGTHEFFRHGGSIGTRLTPGHVHKGKKMPGHMGDERVTVQNLTVARVDEARNIVFVKGGVPGRNGGIVTIRSAVKK